LITILTYSFNQIKIKTMLKNIMRLKGAMQLSKYEQRMLKGGWEREEGCYQQGNMCCVTSTRGDVCREGAICNRGIACTTHHSPR